MSLNALDIGLPRFLEVHYIVSISAPLTSRNFVSATNTLLSEWPLLGMKFSPLRSRLIDTNEKPDAGKIWKGKQVKKTLENVLPSQDAEDSALLSERRGVEKLLDFGYGPPGHLGGFVLSIRSAFLLDACIVGFKVQHPLCDASGVQTIVQSFLDLLDGRAILDSQSPRPPLLKRKMIERTKPVTHEAKHQIADSNDMLFELGWGAFLKLAMKQQIRNRVFRRARRTSKTLFIPQNHVDLWEEEAEHQGFHGTEHDLVLAYIYQASLKPNRSQSFGLVMNIQRYLESQSRFYNPWCLIPIELPSLPQSESHSSSSVVRIATKIRERITDARDPECISQIVDSYIAMGKSPLMLRSFGSRTPNIIVTSWAHLPRLDMGAQHEKSWFIRGSVDACRMTRKAGASLDDMLVLCKGVENHLGMKNGYYVHGLLSEDVWECMASGLQGSKGV